MEIFTWRNKTVMAGVAGLQPSLSRRRILAAGASVLSVGLGSGPGAGAITGRSFYVAKTGNDGNPGTSDKPFLTIGGVFARITDLGPQDRINVRPGVYNEAVAVTAGGNAAYGNLLLLSTVPLGARIVSPPGSYSAITIRKSYVTINGFDVQSTGGGHGIEADRIDGNPANNGPHHLVIINNACHDSPGSGISVAYGDNYRIENNICYRNCSTNPYQGSGISIYQPRAVPGYASTRIFVLRNTCYANTATNLPNDAPHLDGNGIVLDDFRNTQRASTAGAYPYRSLVENNVCYFNGGKGVHVYSSDNVTLRNNTCCFNNRDPKNTGSWRGELSNVNAGNTIWVNNIGYADVRVNSYNRAILHASTNQSSTNVIWSRNLTFNGTAGSASITQTPYNATLVAVAPYSNLLGVDPLFVAAGPGFGSPDLHLQPTSPARDAASTQYGIGSVDREGKPRVSGTAADLGAYERQG